MSHPAPFRYDVFVSYSHQDRAWVVDELLPALEAAGLRICLDERDFEPGQPSILNMERAVDQSRRTLLALSPAWVASEWTAFESLLVQTADPIGRRGRLLPLLVEPCELPPRLAMLTYLDFTRPERRAMQLARLLAVLDVSGEAGRGERAG